MQINNAANDERELPYITGNTRRQIGINGFACILKESLFKKILDQVNTNL